MPWKQKCQQWQQQNSAPARRVLIWIPWKEESKLEIENPRKMKTERARWKEMGRVRALE